MLIPFDTKKKKKDHQKKTHIRNCGENRHKHIESDERRNSLRSSSLSNPPIDPSAECPLKILMGTGCASESIDSSRPFPRILCPSDVNTTSSSAGDLRPLDLKNSELSWPEGVCIPKSHCSCCPVFIFAFITCAADEPQVEVVE